MRQSWAESDAGQEQHRGLAMASQTLDKERKSTDWDKESWSQYAHHWQGCVLVCFHQFLVRGQRSELELRCLLFIVSSICMGAWPGQAYSFLQMLSIKHFPISEKHLCKDCFSLYLLPSQLFMSQTMFPCCCCNFRLDIIQDLKITQYSRT